MGHLQVMNKSNHLKLSLCFKTTNMLVASSVQVQGSSWKCSVDIVL